MRIEPREALVTDAAEILAPAVEHLEAASVKVHVLDAGVTPAEAAARAAQIPVVIIGGMHFFSAEISKLKETGLLIRAGIGYDVIDVEAATAAGIWVANVPDFCVDEVADHTMLLMLSAMRRLPECMTTWRQKRSWHVTATLPAMRRLNGRRLGIVGFGRIGRSVARRAASFGLEVVTFDPFLPPQQHQAVGTTSVDLQELLATSDIVSLHCPLTEETHHLLDARSFETARKGVVILNTSRGGLVDLDALDEAIESGSVSYAALDVLDGEPDPDLDHPILSRPNVLVTSHTAWFSEDASHELAINTAKEAIRYLDGQLPKNLVNPEARSLRGLTPDE